MKSSHKKTWKIFGSTFSDKKNPERKMTSSLIYLSSQEENFYLRIFSYLPRSFVAKLFLCFLFPHRRWHFSLNDQVLRMYFLSKNTKIFSCIFSARTWELVGMEQAKWWRRLSWRIWLFLVERCSLTTESTRENKINSRNMWGKITKKKRKKS